MKSLAFDCCSCVRAREWGKMLDHQRREWLMHYPLWRRATTIDTMHHCGNIWITRSESAGWIANKSRQIKLFSWRERCHDLLFDVVACAPSLLPARQVDTTSLQLQKNELWLTSSFADTLDWHVMVNGSYQLFQHWIWRTAQCAYVQCTAPARLSWSGSKSFDITAKCTQFMQCAVVSPCLVWFCCVASSKFESCSTVFWSFRWNRRSIQQHSPHSSPLPHARFVLTFCCS